MDIHRRSVTLVLEWDDETDRTGHGPPYTEDDWEYAINGEYSGSRVRIVESRTVDLPPTKETRHAHPQP